MIDLMDVESVDVNLVAKPDFSNLYGVKVTGTILLAVNQIYIDDSGNNSRYEGSDPAHVESLIHSFAPGIDLTELPPAVIKRKGKTNKPYELVYGFNRLSALMELGLKKYFFTVLEVENESVKWDVQISENEIKPKKENAEIDIKQICVKKINNGFLKNSEDAIRKELKRICPYRKKQSIDRIVQTIITDCNTPKKFQFYSPVKAQQWLDNHSSEEYVIGGYDDERDMYGYLVKEGYQYRFVMNAIRNYAKYGKKSYCIVHVGSPSGKNTIEVKRQQFIDELNEITKHFLMVSNNGIIAWEIMGFLPQIYGVEDWKFLIKDI